MVMRLGIDVGGTNTDAVILDGRRVLAGVKRVTTRDVMTGIGEALEAVIREAGVAREAIDVAMIGTTHFTNAVIERRALDPVAAIRLGLPATACLPPMVDWPEDLVAEVGGHRYLLHGGHEFDGREIAALDADELARVADDINAKGIR
ncbi:MAG: hydantoinase/oxoprolinase family protein, partial [Rhodobacteraceae bacterium]|nr:hydantoinase/oxoprolinase family protein [Paracoccaceae bacterium]